MPSDVNSLVHKKWNCKYHIVFAPKYRRRIIYGELKAEIGKILRQLSRNCLLFQPLKENKEAQ